MSSHSDKVAACTRHSKTAIKGFFGPYRWLSNFHLCSAMLDHVTYPSSENAYQAAKVPPESRFPFYRSDPADAKRLGRKALIDAHVWDQIKVEVMRKVLWSKFTSNEGLKQKLLATWDKYLEETNWWKDRFWGVYEGVGQNQLGKLLMEIRTELQGR